jgi:anti-sigma B factor antagonist
VVEDCRGLQKGEFVGLQISIRKSDDVTIVDLRGRSTINNGESELFSRGLAKLVASGARKLLLNLADLTQIDSSGVSIIAETYVVLKRQGGRLKLLCPRGRVLQVLTVFRFLDVLESFEDEAEALASFERLDADLVKSEN